VPVTLLPMPDAPVVCLDLWFQAGSLRETAAESGLAHFLEHMVFKGSDGLEPGEFDHRIESLGGFSNAATGYDEVNYHVVLPRDGLELACDLLPRLVLCPSLDPEEFELERQVVLEELAQSEDQPEELAFQRLLELACGSHGYGRAILGERGRLRAHTPGSMEAFRRRHYRSDGSAVAVAGSFDPAEVLDLLNRGPLGALTPTETTAGGGERQLKLQAGEHRLQLPRLESARLLMLWGCPPAAETDDLTGHDLMATVLAEGRRSRLVQRLREELDLVESVDVEIHPLEQGSLAVLECITGVDQLPSLRRELARLLESLTDGLRQEELLRARRLLSHGHTFGLETTGQVAHHLGQQTLQGRLVPLDAPLHRLEGWTLPRLQSLASCWQPDQACCLEVVPA
jgi:zinc protease